MLLYIQLFFVGLIESFLAALNTRFLHRSKRLACFIVSTLSIFIWYYLISLIIEHIKEFWLVAIYAISYGLGDVWAIQFSNYLDKLAKFKGIKIFKKKIKRKKK